MSSVVWLCLMLLLLVIGLLAYRKLKSEHQRQASILGLLPEGIILSDPQGRVLYINQQAKDLLKLEPTFLTQNIQQVLPQAEQFSVGQTRQHYRSMLGKQQLEFELSVFQFEQTQRLYLLHRDILRQAPPEDVERYKRSQYFARIGTWDWRVNTEQLYWSDAIYAMFGYQVGEVQPSYQLFCNCVHPEDREKVKAGEQRCIETGENHDEEYRVVWPDGSIHWVRETGNVVRDKQGQVVKMMGVVRDITEEKNAEDQLIKLAQRDALTGLPNRLALEANLAQAIQQAKADGSRVALMFIDLNKFKSVNDNYGHHRGDQVLIATANKLSTSLRKTDFLARIGGDEFVLILAGLETTGELPITAKRIAEKLLKQLAKPIQIANTRHDLGASLGIAVYPDHATNLDQLLHIADQAMYQAKRKGQHDYQFGFSNQRH